MPKSAAQKKPAEKPAEKKATKPVKDPEYVEAAKKKTSKKRAAPVEEPAPEVDDDAGEAPATDPKDLTERLTKLRQNKRARGYRAKAKEAGGGDVLQSALTLADAKRLMQFSPEVLTQSSYGKDEALMRMALGKESVPASAARETQARCEAMLRLVMNEAVQRAAENGTQGVDAKAMHSVLRKYAPAMLFTAVLPPKGLVRHAQNEGTLKRTDFDTDEKRHDEEKAENKELHSEARANEKALKALKAARAAKLLKSKA